MTEKSPKSLLCDHLLNMYKLIIWDRELAANGKDGGVGRLDVPMDLARYLFQLDAKDFALLSTLSFDDYDLFSDSQIDALLLELDSVSNINKSAKDSIEMMMGIIRHAKELGKCILFDPFGE